MPSTTNVFLNALASKQVDVAPLGEVFVKRYLDGYGRDGATAIDHGLRDDISVLYGPTSSLQDPGKAAAVASYVQIWARAIAWVNANPSAWAQGYYEQNQGLSPEDAAYIVQESGKALVPASWDEAIAQERQIVELLAPVSGDPVFDASTLFDRRFEPVAAAAYARASEGVT
jgi:sulfonate transport system substrate-binding protein